MTGMFDQEMAEGYRDTMRIVGATKCSYEQAREHVMNRKDSPIAGTIELTVWEATQLHLWATQHSMTYLGHAQMGRLKIDETDKMEQWIALSDKLGRLK